MILDERIAKKTINKEYFEYLVKWKGYLVKYLTLISDQDIQLQGFDLAETKNNPFAPQETDARVSCAYVYLTNSKV